MFVLRLRRNNYNYGNWRFPNEYRQCWVTCRHIVVILLYYNIAFGIIRYNKIHNNDMSVRLPLSAYLALAAFRFVFYSVIVNKDDDESTKRDTHTHTHSLTGYIYIYTLYTVGHFAAAAHQFGTSGGEDISNLWVTPVGFHIGTAAGKESEMKTPPPHHHHTSPKRQRYGSLHEPLGPPAICVTILYTRRTRLSTTLLLSAHCCKSGAKSIAPIHTRTHDLERTNPLAADRMF